MSKLYCTNGYVHKNIRCIILNAFGMCVACSYSVFEKKKIRKSNTNFFYFLFRVADNILL